MDIIKFGDEALKYNYERAYTIKEKIRFYWIGLTDNVIHKRTYLKYNERILGLSEKADYIHKRLDVLKERKKILIDFMKMTYVHLAEGMVELSPKPGDVLVAKPHGPKIDEGFTESSLVIGQKQRALVAKRLGFGNLQDDDFQYARYDENCILRPI